MNKYNKLFSALLLLAILISNLECEQKKEKPKEYFVNKLKDSLTIDANLNKPEWKNITGLTIKNILGKTPKYTPKTEVKMLYDDNYIYAIFHVNEKYIKAVATKINDYVYRDSGVEFFFTPSNNISDGYFNLEINCIGTPYFKHQIKFKKNVIDIDTNDIKKIEIAHSLSGIINSEIEKTIDWTLEFKIPINMIKKYAKVIQPAAGVVWRANFYKTADATSNPHYLSWNKIKSKKPNFHLPVFFGIIKFN